MPVCGWVLTAQEDLMEALLETLHTFSPLSIGERSGGRIPLVSDTPGQQSVDELFERVQALPGVLSLHLVFADYSDQLEAEDSCLSPQPTARATFAIQEESE